MTPENRSASIETVGEMVRIEDLLKIRIFKMVGVEYFGNQSIQKNWDIQNIPQDYNLNILIFNKYSTAVYFEYLPLTPVVTCIEYHIGLQFFDIIQE